MRNGHLSDLFSGVIAKRISAVEADPERSNQHEFNATVDMRRLFGDDDRRDIPARFIRFADEETAISASGTVSWYDARRSHPTRTEYRLYYRSNDVTDLLDSGGTLFIALRRNGEVLTVAAPTDSTVGNQLTWLFGLDGRSIGKSAVSLLGGGHDTELGFAARFILDEIGEEAEEPEADLLDRLIARFGTTFPTTRDFSDLARRSLPGVDPAADPDGALLAWMEREERLFRRLERRVVADTVAKGFTAADGTVDVDGFIRFSLSVQNRRKSRVGRALENHIAAVLTAHGIRFDHGALTENRNRPDFLFPDAASYMDPAFPAELLTMLASKSTAKDRWRQALSEAARIEKKHLLTLEPGISMHQTDEMRDKNLQLVMPTGLHATYSAGQQPWLMSVSDFISFVGRKQCHWRRVGRSTSG